MKFDFYAINGGGVPLYTYPHNGCGESMLTSFFTAIYTMSETCFGGNISILNMNKSHMLFLKRENYDMFYVLHVRGRLKEKEASTKLEDLAGKFESTFGDSIKEWRGRVSAFEKFDEYFMTDAEKITLALFGKTI